MAKKSTARPRKKTGAPRKKARAANGKLPTEFALTETERLELENIQLKQQLATTQMNAWAEKVQAKYGVPLSQYGINPTTGQCTLSGTTPTPTLPS